MTRLFVSCAPIDCKSTELVCIPAGRAKTAEVKRCDGPPIKRLLRRDFIENSNGEDSSRTDIRTHAITGRGFRRANLPRRYQDRKPRQAVATTVSSERRDSCPIGD